MTDKFVPLCKQQKKLQRAAYASRRGIWGLNPVTKMPPNPRAYNRRKFKEGDE